MKINIKQIGAFLIATILILAPNSYVLAQSQSADIFFSINRITLNGQVISFDEDARPFVIDDRAYLPLRAISEIFDLSIVWDDNTQTIHLTTNAHLTAAQREAQNYEETAEAYEETTEPYEEAAEAYGEDIEAYEETAEAYEENIEAYEEAVEAYENAAETYEEADEAYEETSEPYEGDTEPYEETVETYEEVVEVYEPAIEAPAAAVTPPPPAPIVESDPISAPPAPVTAPAPAMIPFTLDQVEDPGTSLRELLFNGTNIDTIHPTVPSVRLASSASRYNIPYRTNPLANAGTIAVSYHDLDRNYDTLTARIAHRPGTRTSNVTITFSGDGYVLDTFTRTSHQPLPYDIEIDVTGVQALRIEVVTSNFGPAPAGFHNYGPASSSVWQLINPFVR